MVSFPHCKINLGLSIIAKRPDGFHDIETCFYPVPWTDILEIVPSQRTELDITGLQIPGKPDENLCRKAFDLVKKDYDLPPVHMHLHKLLPTGAGLGGGSSDAAFALRAINEIFQLHLSHGKLVEYASVLGSDCAFFIDDKPLIGTGRGEVLNSIRLSLRGKYLVVVKPNKDVSTADAYANATPHVPLRSVRNILENDPIENWKNYLMNDFEESVFKKFPLISELKHQLYHSGAAYASMSGSGSSVFGIFNKPIDLKSEFPEIIYWSGELE